MKARYTGKTVCPDCGGSRLRKEALYVKIGGKTIADLVVMPVETLADFFASLELDAHDTKPPPASSPRYATACNTSWTWGWAT